MSLVRQSSAVIIVSSLICICSNVSAAVDGQDGPVVLENDHVRMVFEARTAGLTSMTDKATGVDHVHPTSGPHALWRIGLTNSIEGIELANTDYPCSSAKAGKGWGGKQSAKFIWSRLPFSATNDTGTVEVEVELPHDSGIASWKIRVGNQSSAWGLRTVDFPMVNGFLDTSTYDLAGSFGHADTWGSLYPAFKGRLQMRYPDGWRGMSAQFICASMGTSSVYMAAHDPRAWFKEFIIEPGNEFFIRTYAENMGSPGSGYRAPYGARLGVYSGGWLEGCKIYRQFAVTAPWTSNGKVSKGSATLTACRRVGLWMREWDWTKVAVGDFDTMVRQVSDANEYFGVPLGFHWYNWQEADFDTKYPHFFPPKEGVAKLVKKMVDLGLVVMPYINGRIVDQSNSDFSTYQPYTAKRGDDRIYTERYDNHVKQAVMCPYTRSWQNTVVSNVEQMVTGLGVNAVYIDQISAAPPCLCFDKSHGHPLGGGSWWVDGYRKMLKDVRAFARGHGRKLLITSECTAEPYMDGLDALLVVTERSKYSIPILPAVYSGYTTYFGSYEGALENTSNEQFMMEMGRDFVWGCQNGWFGFKLFASGNEQRKSCLRTFALARVAGLKYLADGELVRLFDDGSRSAYQDVPWVQGSVWKAEDGALGIVIVNYRAEKSVIMCTLDPAKYGWRTRGGYRSTRIYPARSSTTDLPTGVIRLSETLDPLEVRIIEITKRK